MCERSWDVRLELSPETQTKDQGASFKLGTKFSEIGDCRQ